KKLANLKKSLMEKDPDFNHERYDEWGGAKVIVRPKECEDEPDFYNDGIDLPLKKWTPNLGNMR
ncbi:hypothetical protein ACFL35_21100, partial [Candidatus Riflebacteria bacterium]